MVSNVNSNQREDKIQAFQLLVRPIPATIVDLLQLPFPMSMFQPQCIAASPSIEREKERKTFFPYHTSYFKEAVNDMIN